MSKVPSYKYILLLIMLLYSCSSMINLEKPNVSSQIDGHLFTTKNGCKLFIYEYQPIENYNATIFIISGITGINHNTEKDVIELLSDHKNKVVVIHPHGTGYSEGVRGDISNFDAFINDYVEVIKRDKDYVSKQHRILLFGHSMSTAVLLAVAEKLKNVAGAILVNPPYILKKAKGMSPGFAQYVKYAWFYLLAKHKPVVNMAGDPTLIESEEDRKESEQRINDPLLVKYFSMYMMIESQKLLKSMISYSQTVNYPLLLIYGEKDNIVAKKGCDVLFDTWKILLKIEEFNNVMQQKDMNKKTILTFPFLLIISCSTNDNEINQTLTYPSFGSEIDVNIVGLTFDAMEPFISPDGEYLFFNNINDGANTKLYYATKIDNSTFTFVGELTGTNQITPPHLDAVADMDSNGNFYWTSTRDYPTELHNLFHGTFDSGNVININRVRGDFNMNIDGWLVMDHGISLDGEFLYFNNARFDSQNCQGPCETNIGVAKKVNATTFNKLPSSTSILQNINNAIYIYYAPFVSSDNLELYYTRYFKGQITANTVFEICVSVRNNPLDSFSVPKVLFSETISNLIEAPTLTVDKEIIYYHKKTASSHKIVMRNRI